MLIERRNPSKKTFIIAIVVLLIFIVIILGITLTSAWYLLDAALYLLIALGFIVIFVDLIDVIKREDKGENEEDKKLLKRTIPSKYRWHAILLIIVVIVVLVIIILKSGVSYDLFGYHWIAYLIMAYL